MPNDLTYYYQQVLKNPTATTQAKADAAKYLGTSSVTSVPIAPAGTGNNQFYNSSIIAPPMSNPGTPVISNTPTYVPDISKVTSLSAATQSMIDTEQKRAADLLAAEKTAQATAAANPPVKSMADYLKTTGQETPQQYQTEQFTKIGVDPTAYFADLKASTEALNALQKDLNTSIGQRDEQIATVQGQGGQTIDFQNAQVERINRSANVLISQKTANLNAQAALIEMKKGNFEQARSYVKDAVDAYTSSIATDLKLFEEFQTNNRDLIDSLDAKYQSAIENVYNLKKNELETAKAETDKVGNLMLQFPNAGISISDSLATATQKASTVSGRKTEIVGTGTTGYSIVTYDQNGKVVSKNPVVGGTSSGTSGSGSAKTIFTQTQLNKGAVAAGVSMEDFAKYDDDTKNWFINSTTQLNQWKALKDRQKMLDEVNISTSIPQTAKDVLLKYVDANYPASKTSTSTAATPSKFTWWNPLTWF